MSHGLTRILKPAGMLAGLTLLVASAGLLTQSSETLLRRSFDRALAPTVAASSVAELKGQMPISGSEDFWLSAMERDARVRSVSLGDKITVTLNGRERSYRVTSVSDILPSATESASRKASDRLLLVTAKDTADALSRPIRFVIDLSGHDAEALLGRPARAS